MSMAEALAAIPEPPGVRLHRCPPVWDDCFRKFMKWATVNTPEALL